MPNYANEVLQSDFNLFLVAYWVKDWANLIGLNTDLCIKHLQSSFPQAFYFLYFFAIPRNVIIACLNFLTLKLLCFLLSILCMHIFSGGGMTLFTPYWHSSHSLFLPWSHLVQHFWLSLSPTKFRRNNSNLQKPNSIVFSPLIQLSWPLTGTNCTLEFTVS